MTPKPYNVRTLRYVARVLGKAARSDSKARDDLSPVMENLRSYYDGLSVGEDHFMRLFRGQANAIARAERAKRKRGGRK